MCTSGVISAVDREGKKRVFLFKTVDYDLVGAWHAVVRSGRGYDALAIGMVPQLGINSGLNEKGLGVCMSYLDVKGVEDSAKVESRMPARWAGDDRGLANAAVLASCTTVEEAIEYYYDFVAKHPGTVGGNHMLADATGNIAVFEHSNGEARHAYYTDTGFAARGNNGLLVIQKQQELLPEEIKKDRMVRYQKMNEFLAGLHFELKNGLNDEVIVQKIKGILSYHAPTGVDQPGSICTHNLQLNGARTNQPLPGCWTITSVIFDIMKLKCYFSIGNPCQDQWGTISFS
ncbi:MAG: carcinine hydrolase/isopenicillin-N N-acyltransferase family protein [Bacillota bacterium]